VRLKNDTSPFLAASTKLFSEFIRVCSSGLKGLAGAFACPAAATAKLQQSKITKTTKLFFIAFSLTRDFQQRLKAGILIFAFTASLRRGLVTNYL
jgi:hypothetical protein